MAGYWPAITAISSTYAARPSPGVPGRWWQQTDGPFSALDRGASWEEYCGGQRVYPQALPTTWRNQDGASLDLTHGGAIMSRLLVNSAESIMIREQAIAGPYDHVLGLVPTVGVRPNGNSDFCYWVGLVLVESATGKLVTFVLQNHHDTSFAGVAVDFWASVTGYGSNHTKWQTYDPGQLFWLRLTDDGTTLSCYWGLTRDNLMLVDTMPHGTGFTVAPDRIGFCMDKAMTGPISPAPVCTTWFTSWE